MVRVKLIDCSHCNGYGKSSSPCCYAVLGMKVPSRNWEGHRDRVRCCSCDGTGKQSVVESRGYY